MVCVCVGEEGGRIACRMMVGERGVALGVEGLMQAGCEYSGGTWEARGGGIAAENDIRKTLERQRSNFFTQSIIIRYEYHRTQLTELTLVDCRGLCHPVRRRTMPSPSSASCCEKFGKVRY